MVWEYTLPRTERKPDYSWGVVRSDCSAPCAGGETVFDAVVLQVHHFIKEEDTNWWFEYHRQTDKLLGGGHTCVR